MNASDLLVEPEPGWHWRNCRSLGLSLHVSPWPWAIVARREDGYDGGRMCLFLGPVGVSLEYGIGNCSSENRLIAATGLSETEAWDRACRYEGLSS